MAKSALFIFLLSAVPALATITKVQSNATWGVTTMTCTVPLSGTTNHNLLAVWATWSPSSLTVSNVKDTNNPSFASAVGPTVPGAPAFI